MTTNEFNGSVNEGIWFKGAGWVYPFLIRFFPNAAWSWWYRFHSPEDQS